jgi:DNA-binding NarL/FixJ family response regulator
MGVRWETPGIGDCLSNTILIVDDSAIIRHTLRACIEQKSGWKVCGEAENGKVAIQKVRELQPDLVILDFQMPVMNGLDAARQITTIAPETPMVMFTMHTCEQLLRDAKAAGIKEVFSKSDGVADHLLASLSDTSPGT